MPDMKAVVVSGRRTPIGKFLGAYKDIPAIDLAVHAARAALEGIPVQCVDLVILGNARQAGNGPNLARQVAHRAGIRTQSPAFTVNMACASGLKAICLAAQAIVQGEADVVLAGGVENMSRTPYLLESARLGYRLGHAQVLDGQYRDGFLCPLSGLLMGETAENLADRYGIGREEQDRYALESQRRYAAAFQAGAFRDEIVAVPLPGKKSETMSVDEAPRTKTTLEDLGKLAPAFREKGSVTPGNACGIADAAAAVVVMSERKAVELGVRPMARLVGAAEVGVDPAYMGIGPVDAVRKLEARSGWRLSEYDLIELNEAFAVQVLACAKDLGLDLSRTNVNGGAIALGHPIGATGARIVVTLLHEMRRRRVRRGLATLCVSGGLGMAVAFEGC